MGWPSGSTMLTQLSGRIKKSSLQNTNKWTIARRPHTKFDLLAHHHPSNIIRRPLIPHARPSGKDFNHLLNISFITHHKQTFIHSLLQNYASFFKIAKLHIFDITDLKVWELIFQLYSRTSQSIIDLLFHIEIYIIKNVANIKLQYDFDNYFIFVGIYILSIGAWFCYFVFPLRLYIEYKRMVWHIQM